MRKGNLLAGLDARAALGQEMHDFAAELFPVCRSITGNGVRTTLDAISRHAPLQISEVPSGTRVLDWTVPDEWNVREAYIADSSGRRIVDFAASNLHLVSYSVPVRARMSLAELMPHLHSLPDQPDLIPYRTSYYQRTWGFCMPETLRRSLREDTYEVVVDTTLAPGALTYGEHVKPGTDPHAGEVLLSAHVCHPSLANDNCSGLALLAMLGRHLATRATRHTYRLLFAPGTIGAITWLAGHRDDVNRISHGLVVSNVGDAGGPTYKRSRRGDATIDRAAAHVLRFCKLPNARVVEFSPYGYDERQYCSPGFDMPVGSLQRSQWGEFPQYHTSADNLDFIRPEHLAQSFRLVVSILDVLERDARYVNQAPYGEPQLGRRGLYGGAGDCPDFRMALLWVLNQSDGRHALLDIAERAALPFALIADAADALAGTDLLRRCED
ncbi:MAG: DUF4910 domain-containing protein [Hyphomicrobiaceae bacterium]